MTSLDLLATGLGLEVLPSKRRTVATNHVDNWRLVAT
jgi:hypothetical protein